MLEKPIRIPCVVFPRYFSFPFWACITQVNQSSRHLYSSTIKIPKQTFCVFHLDSFHLNKREIVDFFYHHWCYFVAAFCVRTFSLDSSPGRAACSFTHLSHLSFWYISLSRILPRVKKNTIPSTLIISSIFISSSESYGISDTAQNKSQTY